MIRTFLKNKTHVFLCKKQRFNGNDTFVSLQLISSETGLLRTIFIDKVLSFQLEKKLFNVVCM